MYVCRVDVGVVPNATSHIVRVDLQINVPACVALCLTLDTSVDMQVYALFELDISFLMFLFEYVICCSLRLVIASSDIQDWLIFVNLIYILCYICYPLTGHLAQSCSFCSHDR